MANQASRVGLRVVAVILICIVAFYVGRPLYWKVSATLQEVREKNDDAQAMKDGLAQLMLSAQSAVGWANDESDSGLVQKAVTKSAKKVQKTKNANARKLAYL